MAKVSRVRVIFAGVYCGWRVAKMAANQHSRLLKADSLRYIKNERDAFWAHLNPIYQHMSALEHACRRKFG